MQIAGKVVLVTGANRGVGRAFVEALAARGAAKIYAGARDPARLADLAARFNGKVEPVKLDITSVAEIETNYLGPLAMCRAFAPVLKANGGGVIVNMLSIAARVNLPMYGSLSASKAAALSMTQGVRAELAAQGTFVVAVMPGAIDTEMEPNFPPPKLPPAEAARIALDAVEQGLEDVYPGDMAAAMSQGLAADAKAVEKDLAKYLPL